MLPEQRGGAKQRRCVGVVSAGVHGPGDLRRIGTAAALFNGESVDVSAEKNGGIMPFSAQYGDNTRGQAEPQLLQTERGKGFTDLCRCLKLLLGKLGMLVKRVAKIEQRLFL